MLDLLDVPAAMSHLKVAGSSQISPLRGHLLERNETVKILNLLVPRVGVEPTRPYGQRILSPLRGYLPHATTRYQAVFTDVSVVKARFVRLGIST